ncbi:MAG TPA: hypothetical protein PK014_03940 [Thermoanaerobaculia bacterium]|nr:hypothetical protein [Thermoanaerobaculia bacterium]HUM29207.1 hypothetical protein [Thermoanaerobaculia bacterium]HXK67834.1 hypothetical protein [Thermoanaerobaculia bacterium]
MKRIQRLFLVLFLSVCALSCIPVFENPLPKDTEFSVDPALLGSWILKEGDVQLFFFPDQPGVMQVLSLENFSYQPYIENKNIMLAEGFTAKIKGHTYLCMKMGEHTRQVSGLTDFSNDSCYIILHYEISKDTLTLNHLEPDYFAEAVTKKKLTGRNTSDKGLKDPIISADSESIAAFFRDADFSKMVDRENSSVFTRKEALYIPPEEKH